MSSEGVDPEITDMRKILVEVVKQCITTRDQSWKLFYEQEMNSLENSNSIIDVTEVLEVEKKAESLNNMGQYIESIDLIQSLIDKENFSTLETGWYLQMMARFKYRDSVTESNNIQTSAFKKNKSLLKPKEGYRYKKIFLIEDTRTANIIQWIKSSGSHAEIDKRLEAILSLLAFEEKADHFENGIKQLGTVLGFESQRPDKDDREGPDNLWALSENDYLLFECKNEVRAAREEINKHETGQMNNSCGWFKSNYLGANFKPIMIISTRDVSKQGIFNFDVGIMRKNSLKKLKNNTRNFFKELRKFDVTSLSQDLIQNNLNSFQLDNYSIKELYSEKPYYK